MFTSRAEFRILLRQENADIRLTPLGYNLGLASQERMDAVEQKQEDISNLLLDLKTIKVSPNDVNDTLKDMNSATIREKAPLVNFLKRPEINIRQLNNLNKSTSEALAKYSKEIQDQVEVQIKYDTYITKEKKLADKMQNLDSHNINPGFNYATIKALSSEAREKLLKVKPINLGQASRISGVSPSDISVLMIYMGK